MVARTKEQAMLNYLESVYPTPVSSREVAFGIGKLYAASARGIGYILSGMDNVERIHDTYCNKYRLIK